MRSHVKIRYDRDTGNYILDVTESQFHLLRRSTVTFFALVQSPIERELILGSSGASLHDLLALGVAYDDVTPASIFVSFQEVHALYAILTTLPTLIASEESFVERIGFFTENVLSTASGLRRGIIAAAALSDVP